MTEPFDTLVPFISRLQLDRLRARGPRRGATAESLEGTLLFLDAVGFSSAAEQLRDEGAQGAERLSELLSAYFHPVLEEIRQHGGDVLFFAGDAIAAAWRSSDSSAAGLREAALRAAQCALALQARIPTVTPPWGTALRFRASLGSGLFEALELGGVRGRWMQVVRGPALARAFEADSSAEPDQVTLCPATLTRLESAGPDVAPGEGGFSRLSGLRHHLEPVALPPPSCEPAERDDLAGQLRDLIANRFDPGDGDLHAEFRQVTVVFTNLHRPAAGTPPPDLVTFQEAVAAAQSQADRFEGAIYELVDDDKGTGVVAAFGLPGTSHSDDPVRAVLATRALHEALHTLGLTPVSGVATGVLYCGPHGDAGRRHYAMIGPTINLAARIMSLAQEHGVLCDGTTRKLAQERIGFREAGWTTPKGFPAPVPLFEVTGEAEPPRAAEDQPVVGRALEIGIIAQALDRVMRDRTSRVVVIRAEPGMGKSTLVKATETLARDRSVRLSRGQADSFETGTAYFAFRRLAREWFVVPPDADAGQRQACAARALADAPALAPLLPLIGGVLGFDLPETPDTAQVRGPARAEAVRDMLLHVAANHAAGLPLVLALEDGHWLDAASWALLHDLLGHVAGALLVLTTRPLPRPHEALAALLARDDAEIIDLVGFSRAETEALIRDQLGVSEVAPAVLDLVTRRAEGNPFFAREVLRSLKESGGIRIRSGRVELVLAEDAVLPLPATVEGVITSRIDRLERASRTTIKVAAVLGRGFDPELLLAIHPARPERGALTTQLDELVAASLLAPGESSRELVFDHALTHEAAYNLLSFSQREALHRATAERLEATHADNLKPVQARLGYHFRLAELPERAVPYLAAAGEEAVDAYASRDAIDLLTAAITLDERVRGDPGLDLQRARWCRLIGQALYHLDEQAQAGEWYRRAIAYAGAGSKRLSPVVIGTLLRAALAPGTIVRFSPAELPADVRARLVEGLAAARELAIVYLWENDKVRFALRLFESVPVARRLGPSEESADAFATIGFLLGLIGLRRTGERITAEAVAIADSVGDIRQLVSTTTVAGMLRTQNGRPLEGLSMLQRSDQTATALRSGLYRHRPKYMLADTLLWLGRYPEARGLFQHSAELSRGAEHHVFGLANAMVALTLVREGRPEAAIHILESPDGVPSVLEGKVIASVVIGLGVLAEARLDLGDREAALDAVREAEAWLTPTDDGTAYFATIFGHAAIARVRLETGELGEPVRRGLRRVTPFDAVMDRLRSIRRRFPAAQARLSLLEGQVAAGTGRHRRARRLLRRAIAAATAHDQPYELGRSLVELAQLVPDPRRKELLDQAIRVFENHGMALESGRARTLLQRR